MNGNQRLVLLTVFVWVVLIAPYPLSLGGWGIVITLTLVVLDVLLGVRTGWLAFARPSTLDEREIAVRDRAYRLAFRVVALGIALMIVSGYASTVISFFVDHTPGQPALPDPLGARRVAGLLELLVAAPLAVIAWRHPRVPEAGAGQRRLRAWFPLVAAPLVAGLWFLALVALPPVTETRHQVPGALNLSGAHCGEFVGSREVGAGFGAALRFHAAVCWDGRQAWVFGDPSLPQPSFVADLVGATPPPDPWLTSCQVVGDAADFATLRNQHCTETIDSDGTMHYVAIGRVSAGPGDLGARDLRLELTVTRDGHIVEFG
jgi:hypothetical protein